MKQLENLKIAMLCYPRRSGITHYTYSLCAELAAYVPGLYLIVNRSADMRPAEARYKEARLFTRTRWLGLDFIRLLALVYKENIGILHFQSALKNWFVDFPLLLVLKMSGRKIVFTAHDVLPHVRKAFEIKFIRLLYRLFDLVIVHSESSRKQVAAMNVAPEKIYTIPHGLYTMFLPQQAVSPAEARRELGLNPADKILLFFGSINPRKGAEKVVAGFEKVVARQKNVTLVMAGTNDYAEGYLENLAQQKGISDQVKIFGTWVPNDRVYWFFSAADMVILPYNEGFTSGVLKLAYAFKKPVITSGVGELTQVVESEKTGIVLEAFFSDETARRVLDVLNSERQLADFRKNPEFNSEVQHLTV
jgi:glycosyltransferase involved in cell wall biosynthesis